MYPGRKIGKTDQTTDRESLQWNREQVRYAVCNMGPTWSGERWRQELLKNGRQMSEKNDVGFTFSQDDFTDILLEQRTVVVY